MILVLDNEALNAFAGRDSPRKRQVRRASRPLRAAVGTWSFRPSSSPSPIAAQPALERLIPCSPAIAAQPSHGTPTGPLARFVGAVLHAAGAGSKDIVDAHVVAVAAEVGGGLDLTGDPSDLERLAAPYRSTVIEPLR